jgi:hypothetical protein
VTCPDCTDDAECRDCRAARQDEDRVRAQDEGPDPSDVYKAACADFDDFRREMRRS